jgi:glycosyltransferase involved in cell wall biosynthesis
MAHRPLILVLITKADIGGAQVHVLEILMHLQTSYRFILATGETDFLSERAKALGIEVRLLKHLKRPINLLEDRHGLMECIALLRELKPDLLHLHSSKAGVIGRLAALRTGVRCLFTAHGWAFTEGAPTLQRAYGLVLESVLCRLKGRVVTVSNYDFELAGRFHVGAAKNRFRVINGISAPGVETISHSPAELRIVTIGRLSSVKNHLLLLDVLAALSLPFQAQIIGEGQCREKLEQRIKQLGLGGRVELLGEVRQTSDYLAHADLFVLTSNYEGLPLSVLEAMSYGLPVIATDVGGVNEAVLHQQSGLLCKRGNVNDFVNYIERLGRDSKLRRQYGKKGKLHYAENFTSERMIGALQDIYESMLKDDL